MTLWRAVQLAVQERHLAIVSTSKQLGPSHQTELLAVRDLSEKRRLAQEAAEQGWSVQDLRAAARRQRKVWKRTASRAGLRSAVRALRGATRQVARLLDHPAPLVALPSDDLRQLLVLLEKTVAALGASIAAARPVRRRKA